MNDSELSAGFSHSTKRFVMLSSIFLLFRLFSKCQIEHVKLVFGFCNMQRIRKQIYETMTTDTLIDFTTCANVSGYRIHLISLENQHKSCATHTYTEHFVQNAVIQKDTTERNSKRIFNRFMRFSLPLKWKQCCKMHRDNS